ncbi:EAL domain-containing protein [Actinoplanes sp. NBRC 101535]|uniref:putative bifunctional diguanylate cyclase/phosphodiesterase n=1 Tax=Actinoplanes sp. NBRC 101535 TaxID=3032196 RepID=UPI0024A1CF9C|nr:EAL domain-containing protein [Actinoplanes sp. NBRC 101535]GLY06462.1 hypothetical protein Acsp01_68410 [Actinoplanes sp. NBRC 101535]
MKSTGDRVANAAVAGTGLILAAFLVFYLGSWGDDETRQYLTDLIHVPISLVFTLLALRVVVHGGRTVQARRAWVLITAAFFCRFASQVSWFVEDAMMHRTAYPAYADYWMILYVPLMFVGLLLMPAARRSRIDRIKLTLDALIVAAGTFMVLWYLLLGPIFVSRNVPIGQVAYSAALPMGDLLLVLALAMLLMRRTGSGDPAIVMLAGAVAMFVIADVGYGYLQLHVGFAGGSWPDLFWLGGGFLMVLAAHRTYWSGRGAPDQNGRSARVNWLPYGAIALAYGILGYLAREQGMYPLGGMIIGAILMTALVIARQMYVLRENQDLAVTDPLTGLPNRALINTRIAALAAQPARSGRCHAVMLIDLDKFKPINDVYGHEAGDAVLEAAAVTLRTAIRAGDTAGRLGGDEFAVILRDLPDRGAVERVAQRLVGALRTPIVFGEVVLCVEASIGVAIHDALHPVSPDLLLRQADLAMYTAKRSGRSRYQVYTPDLDPGGRAAELRSAIENGDLIVHYQPVVALGSGETTAVEALVRWEHPERGLLPPADFLDLAEETGVIVPLGEWMLRESCRQAAEWHDRIPAAAHLDLSVNLSAQQVMQEGLPGVVAAILDDTGFPAERLILEITEGVVLDADDKLVTRLEELRDSGVRIAVDDFGTGYSALGCLRRLPIGILKIDGSLTAGLPGDATARQLAEAVIRLGQIFAMEVVAEGIETAEQARTLRDLGCERGQGFHLYHPMPAAYAVEALGEHAGRR